MQAILTDWHTAAVSSRLGAALDFLEKLTLRPEEIGPEDVRTARSRGVSDAALEQAVYVCSVFSAMDRIADALAMELPDDIILKRYAWIAAKFGYKGLSLPG